jgi:hypothetical protein
MLIVWGKITIGVYQDDKAEDRLKRTMRRGEMLNNIWIKVELFVASALS